MENPGENGPSVGHMQKGAEDKTSKTPSFKTTLTQIQSRPLSPENIDSYAEDALTDLVNLSASILSEYKIKHASDTHDGKEAEDKAFKYFGLSNLEQILDHVSSKAEEIKQIDRVIQNAENIDSIMVPPDSNQFLTHEGDRSFREKSIISRTKTLLFVLSNDFDVDLNNPEQLLIKTGVLSDNMMRRLSYVLIIAPKLNRTILCCDEEGNITYVFNNTVLNKYEISPNDLASLTKPDLNELLENDSELGRRVVYSNKFVPKMIGLINNLQINNDAQTNENTGHYLYPKAPEGILPVTGIAKSLGIGNKSVKKAIEEIKDTLGETGMYKFHSNPATGYTKEQQEMIIQRLEEKGIFALEKAPEGILSIAGIAKSLGITYESVKKAIEETKDTLGETGTYIFHTTPRIGYTKEQQEKIIQRLEEKGVFAVKKAPEGILSAARIAKSLKVDYRAVEKAIKEIRDTLGEINTYRFHTTPRIGYTKEQQEKIIQRLEEKGVFAVKKAPEGILSAARIAKSLGITYESVKKAIEETKDTLGETNTYSFHSNPATGYTKEQQEMIKQYLRKKGLIE